MKRKSISLDGVDIPLSDNVTCLGMVFDNVFHTYQARKCFLHLRQLHYVSRSLSINTVKTLVNAFITSPINYCNSVFSRVATTQLHPLQSALNVWQRDYLLSRASTTRLTATIQDIDQLTV